MACRRGTAAIWTSAAPPPTTTESVLDAANACRTSSLSVPTADERPGSDASAVPVDLFAAEGAGRPAPRRRSAWRQRGWWTLCDRVLYARNGTSVMRPAALTGHVLGHVRHRAKAGSGRPEVTARFGVEARSNSLLKRLSSLHPPCTWTRHAGDADHRPAAAAAAAVLVACSGDDRALP